MNTSEIRKAFIDFFSQREHQVVESSSLIPGNDPTLLFTNAGMVPFKDVFLGREQRDYVRAVSAQRCLRAGGKHNDLENVGYTARHHTFFEMLGNFSFGDYFKREAIHYGWEFLTEVLKLPPGKLWVTVHESDSEAADIWLKEIGISSERFSWCGDADNFWSMGDTGPCGPCSEVFYDHGPDIVGGPPGSPDADGDRYIEIWNMVFMQYNRNSQGDLQPLPKPSVDTGMGLERISAVIQGVHSNYDIDIFQFLINSIANKLPGVNKNHASLRVIADHIRACAFLVADGILPGNEGRSYVLRRIIRRAIRHGHSLGLPSPFFADLVEPLATIMGEAYPVLITKQNEIATVLSQEEVQFSQTLENGLRLLQNHIENQTDNHITGEMAFKLYDTYGFPVDLTADIARENGLTVDMDGFEKQMQKQRKQSKSASQFRVDYNTMDWELNQTHSLFQGYENESLDTHIVALRAKDANTCTLECGQEGFIVLADTPFYAESGGQVGDKGIITTTKAQFLVKDTQKSGQVIVHHGVMQTGSLSVGEKITATVDSKRRQAIRLNHTSTHLLHAALKQILGNDVHQRGSLVDAARARFDFSYTTSLTQEQKDQIENIVNAKILENLAVDTALMSLDEATQSGAVALFDEKYDKQVRVLSIGDFSKELCGGTHAARTGDIGLFKLIAEYGIASGVRRVEWVTGISALEWVQQQSALLDSLTTTLKATSANIKDKLGQLLQDNKNQEKLIQQLQAKLATHSTRELILKARKVGDVSVLVERLSNLDLQGLRTTLDALRSELANSVIVLYAVDGDSLQAVAGISKSLVGQVPDAGEYVRCLCGRGGGRADMAQGGGAKPPKLDEQVAKIFKMIAERMD